MREKSCDQSEARKSMMLPKRQGQVQLWDQSGRLRSALANEINAISKHSKNTCEIL